MRGIGLKAAAVKQFHAAAILLSFLGVFHAKNPAF